MIAAVVYKPGKFADPLMESVREFFGVEKLAVRGLGVVERYETRDISIYFIPVRKSYELHAEEMENLISEGIGRPYVVVSINPHIADMREGIFIHSAGNITGENILGGGFSPKSVAKTDPGTIGMVVRAVYKFAEELETPPVINIEATHDFPTKTSIPYLSFEVRGDYYDLAALSLVASLGKEIYFKPYLTIGISYYANEFIPVILRKKKVPAYHVPFYLAHHLSADFLRTLKREGYIEGVAYGRGVDRDKLPF